MNMKYVKAAKGCRLRHPKTGKVVPVEGDAAAPVLVNMEETHWFRALNRGDLVVVAEPPSAAVPAPTAPIPTPPAASAASSTKVN